MSHFFGTGVLGTVYYTNHVERCLYKAMDDASQHIKQYFIYTSQEITNLRIRPVRLYGCFHLLRSVEIINLKY